MSAQGAKQCLGLEDYPKKDNPDGWERLRSYTALVVDLYDQFNKTHSGDSMEGLNHAAKALTELTSEALRAERENASAVLH